MARLFEYTQEMLPLALFEDISKVPRPSGREEKIADFLEDWARARGLACARDDVNNLVIRKPGTQGKENSDPVILQSHMDMVCEKEPGSSHDFDADPIELIVDGDMLRADGTTLGADDGIGMGLSMAALVAEGLEHPPLEVLITTDEEGEFTGANGLKPDFVKGMRLINLDSCTANQIMLGSCGGTGMGIYLPMNKAKCGEGEGGPGGACESAGEPGGSAGEGAGPAAAYRIEIKGMLGGHSGEDIHRGHGSAIQLMGNLLRDIFRPGRISLAEIGGGSSRLAISRDAAAVIVISGGKTEEEKVKERIAELGETYKKIYQVCRDMEVLMVPCEMPEEVYEEGSFAKLLTLLTILPNGIQKMNGSFPGVVESSLNLGIVREEPIAEDAAGAGAAGAAGESCVYLELELRGAFDATILEMKEKVACACELTGAAWKSFGAYAPWEYRSESALRDKAVETYEALFGEKMEPVIVHGGLECGCIIEACGRNMEAISIGPDCWNLHSPSECLSISSTGRMWEYLKALLKNL